MSTPAQKVKSLGLVLGAAGLVILLAGFLYLTLTPKTYQAFARVEVVNWDQIQDQSHPIDLNLVSADAAALRSPLLLDQVIRDLSLSDHWSTRDHKLSLEETRALLLSQALIAPRRNSSVIEIRVTSSDANDASRIANALARVYISHRQALHQRANADLNAKKLEHDDWTKKIQAAQTTVDKLYFDISRNRITNGTQLYDAEAYDTLISKKVEIEGQYVAKKDELDRLTQMTPNERVQVLSSMDTNSPLNTVLMEAAKVKSELLKADLEHGSNSRETKDAALAIENLNQKNTELCATAMSVKQTELRGLASALEQIKRKISNGTTNAGNDQFKFAEYQSALTNLSLLQHSRDELDQRIADQANGKSDLSLGATAQIIDSADTPSQTFTPNHHAVKTIFACGFLLSLAGAFLIAVGIQSPGHLAKRPA